MRDLIDHSKTLVREKISQDSISWARYILGPGRPHGKKLDWHACCVRVKREPNESDRDLRIRCVRAVMPRMTRLPGVYFDADPPPYKTTTFEETYARWIDEEETRSQLMEMIDAYLLEMTRTHQPRLLPPRNWQVFVAVFPKGVRRDWEWHGYAG